MTTSAFRTQPFVKGSGEFGEVYAQGLAEAAKLNHVNPALSALALADERLCLTDSFGELFLSYASLLAGLTKVRDEALIFFGDD